MELAKPGASEVVEILSVETMFKAGSKKIAQST
jgi:hypothetical protein